MEALLGPDWMGAAARRGPAGGRGAVNAPTRNAADSRLAGARRRHGGERAAMSSMRARLMAYTRGMEGGRNLRGQLSHVSSLAELEDIAAQHLEECSCLLA